MNGSLNEQLCVSCDCSPDCFSLGSVLGTRVGAVLYLTLSLINDARETSRN